MAGARIYAGMVQREGAFLTSQMISDGVYWDGPKQVNFNDNTSLNDFDLAALDYPYPYGKLTPNEVFDYLKEDGTFGETPTSGIVVTADFIPQEFLKNGLFINDNGSVYDDWVVSNAVYGGKPIYRVSIPKEDSKNNSVLDPNTPALTEYRIEVNHTSDGRLPVTEQTDLFDADRIPRSVPTNTDRYGSTAPFIEVVYGSVVGNDPFSIKGRSIYGNPLKPDLESSNGPDLISGVGSKIGDHAASLFRLRPLTTTPSSDTWWSTTKDGRFKASVQGPKDQDFSAEIFLNSGLRVKTGGAIRLETEKGLQLEIGTGDTSTNNGLDLSSKSGAVRIYGGGNTNVGSVDKKSSTSYGNYDQPSVLIEGKNNVNLRSSKKVLIETSSIETKSQDCSINTQSGISLRAGDRLGINSATLDIITTGKCTQTFHGPKDNLPTFGSFRDTKFTGIGVGVVDDYFVLAGNRLETFVAGNHTTTIMVGNMTYQTSAGVWSAIAGGNLISIDSASGINELASVGNITISAVAGTTAMVGQVAVNIRSSGTSTLSGATGVYLGGPGNTGGIVCWSDLDPLTGLPLLTFGMGSPGHLIGPSI
jgi:hypothetical protein